MKKILLVSIFFLLINCSKPKAVFICGDHVCINNAEANQYFEENMTIQVQIIDKKKDSEFDLVELNLRHNKDNRKEVTFSKSLTKNEVRPLSKEEIQRKKEELKKKKKNKKIVKKYEKNKIKKKEKKIKDNNLKKNIDINKKLIKRKDLVDVCTFVEKCSIEEISKFLIKQGKDKNYPDLTLRN